VRIVETGKVMWCAVLAPPLNLLSTTWWRGGLRGEVSAWSLTRVAVARSPVCARVLPVLAAVLLGCQSLLLYDIDTAALLMERDGNGTQTLAKEALSAAPARVRIRDAENTP